MLVLYTSRGLSDGIRAVSPRAPMPGGLCKPAALSTSSFSLRPRDLIERGLAGANSQGPGLNGDLLRDLRPRSDRSETCD